MPRKGQVSILETLSRKAEEDIFWRTGMKAAFGNGHEPTGGEGEGPVQCSVQSSFDFVGSFWTYMDNRNRSLCRVR